MAKQADVSDLRGLAVELWETAKQSDGRTTVGELVQRFGPRPFGILLVLPALLAFTPLGGIPGIPTVMASFVGLVALQLLVGKTHLWIPAILRRREIRAERLQASLEKIMPLVGAIDRVIRPRLFWFTNSAFIKLIAASCILLALTVPPLEVVPFGGSASWAGIGFFGLSIVGHDGLLALMALVFSVAAVYLIFTTVL